MGLAEQSRVVGMQKRLKDMGQPPYGKEAEVWQRGARAERARQAHLMLQMDLQQRA